MNNKKIEMSLNNIESDSVKGHYYEDCEKKILLKGRMKNDSFELTEYYNHKIHGYLTGKIYRDSIGQHGTWYDSLKQKKIFFIFYQDYDAGFGYQRYYDFGNTDDEVENFMKEAKAAIISDNKQWVADHFLFPYRSYKTKQQFLINYEKIITPAFKKKIEAFCYHDLFCNYQGAMLGNGEIWIGSRKQNGKENLVITWINN